MTNFGMTNDELGIVDRRFIRPWAFVLRHFPCGDVEGEGGQRGGEVVF
jgi:hypothetical protein